MTWFPDFSTRGKLFTGFGLMLALTFCVIGVAYNGLGAIRAQNAIDGLHRANALDLMAFRNQQNRERAALLSMIEETEPAARDKWRRELDASMGEMDHIIERLRGHSSDNPEMLAQLKNLAEVRHAASDFLKTELIPQIHAAQLDNARTIALRQGEPLLAKGGAAFADVRTVVDRLGKASADHARVDAETFERTAEGAVNLLVGMGVVALALGLAVVTLLHHNIALPMRAVSAIAEQVAIGNLAIAIPRVNRRDEVGLLVRTFSAMVDTMRRTTGELHQGVSVLNASASDILATTTQMASGATETATAVSQTTITVGEVKQTAELASQKAHQVSTAAQKTVQISQTGRQSVENTIDDMARIQEQMEVIAGNIERLSEQNQAIGEIITSVNDLAEQSNLLAVNAAIEAAKAGEQGKGFAVVAHEIKSLAEQSRQATARVRGILGDIQKATAAAVLATEQGSLAAAAGVKQSRQTGESIRLLADSINEAAQAAIQIGVSSQQQMAGMDQVVEAMDHIRLVSTQNVAGTRQAEATARQLHQLGQSLKKIASHYRV